MPFIRRTTLFTLVAIVATVLLLLAGFVWSGLYNIGADDRHTRPVHALLQVMRDRSISVRANELHPPPNLNDAAMIRQGAGNYAAMCAGCHLAPGMGSTELSRGLYPAPPALAKLTVSDPAHHFWVIKHGIKASGMPAWGNSMRDEYIWGIVAFLQQLPTLDAEEYERLVASSGGHSHGGGETQPHGLVGDADDTIEPRPAAAADDGHDHEH